MLYTLLSLDRTATDADGDPADSGFGTCAAWLILNLDTSTILDTVKLSTWEMLRSVYRTRCLSAARGTNLAMANVMSMLTTE